MEEPDRQLQEILQRMAPLGRRDDGLNEVTRTMAETASPAKDTKTSN